MSVEYLVYNDMCLTEVILQRFMEMAPEFTERLQSIWKEMGISAATQCDRVDAVISYIHQLLSDMVTDEENLLKELTSTMEKYKEELRNLAQILGWPQYEPKEDLSLVEKEKDLRTKLDAWNLEKHERLKSVKRLREKEDALCKRLALPPHDTSIGEIPTATQIREIEANIEYMENELTQAKSHFRVARQSILKLWEELEIDGVQTVFSEIVSDDAEDSCLLSKANLLQLKEHLNKLEKQQDYDRDRSVELMKQLKSLWMKLEINEKDQNAFKTKCTGYRPSAIRQLKSEVDKYESMKLKYTEKFILGSRKELNELWDKCFFGEEQRRQFSPAFDDNVSEEALKIHEHQVRVMQNYYEENKAIFKLVEKRENMWNKLLEYEHKENDPARLFTNRGGALLKELKLKNAVQKGLPKVEEDLKRAIKLWQKENEDLFLVNGEKYLELIQLQQENREKEKNLAKLGKQKAKKEALAKEMVFGSKPAMPAKRGINRTCTIRSPTNNKKKRHDKSSSSTISLTSIMVSQCNTPAPAIVKSKKKGRRLSSKIKKHVFPTYKKRSNMEDVHDTDEEEYDEIDESLNSLCSYPDFTHHIRRGSEKELSSTAATVDSSQSLSPVNSLL